MPKSSVIAITLTPLFIETKRDSHRASLHTFSSRALRRCMKENEYIPLDICKHSTEFDVCQGLYNI